MNAFLLRLKTVVISPLTLHTVIKFLYILMKTKCSIVFTAVLTTKAVMAGTLFLLTHFPEIQEKIRHEIASNIGDREPTVADMTSMPYTQACMMEILRYQSHLPLTAAHANLDQEVELEGFTIPKGTVVNTFSIFLTYLHSNRILVRFHCYT